MGDKILIQSNEKNRNKAERTDKTGMREFRHNNNQGKHGERLCTCIVIMSDKFSAKYNRIIFEREIVKITAR